MVCKKDGTEIRKLPLKKNEKYIKKLDTAYKQHLALIFDEFYDMASGSAMYIRKAFLENEGYFDEKYVLWEDGPFITQYTKKKMIVTAYKIISIKYRLGGVSNGKPHPLMRRDRELYNKTERIEDMSLLTNRQRRKVNYICKRYITSSLIKKIFLYLKYPDIMFEKVIYKIRQE